MLKERWELGLGVEKLKEGGGNEPEGYRLRETTYLIWMRLTTLPIPLSPSLAQADRRCARFWTSFHAHVPRKRKLLAIMHGLKIDLMNWSLWKPRKSSSNFREIKLSRELECILAFRLLDKLGRIQTLRRSYFSQQGLQEYQTKVL